MNIYLFLNFHTMGNMLLLCQNMLYERVNIQYSNIEMQLCISLLYLWDYMRLYYSCNFSFSFLYVSIVFPLHIVCYENAICNKHTKSISSTCCFPFICIGLHPVSRFSAPHSELGQLNWNWMLGTTVFHLYSFIQATIIYTN